MSRSEELLSEVLGRYKLPAYRDFWREHFAILERDCPHRIVEDFLGDEVYDVNIADNGVVVQWVPTGQDDEMETLTLNDNLARRDSDAWFDAERQAQRYKYVNFWHLGIDARKLQREARQAADAYENAHRAYAKTDLTVAQFDSLQAGEAYQDDPYLRLVDPKTGAEFNVYEAHRLSLGENEWSEHVARAVTHLRETLDEQQATVKEARSTTLRAHDDYVTAGLDRFFPDEQIPSTLREQPRYRRN